MINSDRTIHAYHHLSSPFLITIIHHYYSSLLFITSSEHGNRDEFLVSRDDIGGESMRPFEGVKILDCTHVLAGPFTAYQLAVLGADVIKVEDPNEPDQSRETGGDVALNKARMGTSFLTQGSNKRSIALNLKTEGGREALKRLVVDWADVFIENYRPGAFKALGLGYDELSRLKPRLVYASMTAFGQDGPRGTQTAYDHAIQATSGLSPCPPRSTSACARARDSTSIWPCSTSP
jgi:crotonobetainyl-CoA:carnitine CoA-transferase CaiB-like acyl-CoA transferase